MTSPTTARPSREAGTRELRNTRFPRMHGHREACRMPVGVGTHVVVVVNVETQMHGFSQVCVAEWHN